MKSAQVDIFQRQGRQLRCMCILLWMVIMLLSANKAHSSSPSDVAPYANIHQHDEDFQETVSFLPHPQPVPASSDVFFNLSSEFLSNITFDFPHFNPIHFPLYEEGVRPLSYVLESGSIWTWSASNLNTRCFLLLCALCTCVPLMYA